MRILILYAGVGGESDLWDDVNNQITHIEYNKEIAKVLSDRKPNRTVVVADAHQYLLGHYKEYDGVWSSPPCQKHSKMNRATRHNMVRYVDGRLFEEIIFLQTYFKGWWVVENVIPYYEPYGNPVKIGRHLFWSNRQIAPTDDYPKSPKGMMNLATVGQKKIMMDWLGIHYEKNIYYEGNHCPVQVLRNCVHPVLGKYVFDQVTSPPARQ